MNILKISFQYSTYTAKETPFRSEIMRYNDLERTNTFFLRKNRNQNVDNVNVNSKTAHPPRAIPGHLTRVKLRTVGNLTQNEARPVGHLTFVPKRLSAVGSKRISQFFDSAGEPRSRVIALVDSTWVFLLLSFCIVLPWNMPLFKVWSEDKLNKKFVVAENFAELVSTVCFNMPGGWGI